MRPFRSYPLAVLFYLWNMRFTVWFFYFFYLLSTWIFWLNVFLVVFRIQRVILFYFPASFFCCLKRKQCFYRHQVLSHHDAAAIKELQKAGYKLVTVAECLGKEPHYSEGPSSTREVFVYLFILPAYFLTFLGRILGIVKCFVIYKQRLDWPAFPHFFYPVFQSFVIVGYLTTHNKLSTVVIR